MECDDSGHVNEDLLDNPPAIMLSVHSQYSRPSHIIFGDVKITSHGLTPRSASVMRLLFICSVETGFQRRRRTNGA